MGSFYSSERGWATGSLGGHRQRNNCRITITIDMLEALALRAFTCYICGTKLEYGQGAQLTGYRKARENTPSLDVVDGGNMVTADNVAIACLRCNCFKQNLSLDGLISECKLIASKKQALLSHHKIIPISDN